MKRLSALLVHLRRVGAGSEVTGPQACRACHAAYDADQRGLCFFRDPTRSARLYSCAPFHSSDLVRAQHLAHDRQIAHRWYPLCAQPFQGQTVEFGHLVLKR